MAYADTGYRYIQSSGLLSLTLQTLHLYSGQMDRNALFLLQFTDILEEKVWPGQLTWALWCSVTIEVRSYVLPVLQAVLFHKDHQSST